jgi:hypothetical protein
VTLYFGIQNILEILYSISKSISKDYHTAIPGKGSNSKFEVEILSVVYFSHHHKVRKCQNIVCCRYSLFSKNTSYFIAWIVCTLLQLHVVTQFS